MKRQPKVPQFEFGFSGDSFALVGERSAAKSDAPTILAEMTDAEREAARTQAKTKQTFIGELSREMDAEPSEVERTPGLAPGSYWSNPMAKALATMQRGKR